jgi:hypothetical protein
MVGFLVRAVFWFNSQGITFRRVICDYGSAYRSKQWRQACTLLGLKVKRTRAYRPQTNGKMELFIKPLQAERAYARSFTSSEECKRWLPRYLAIYNGRRSHMAIGGLTPFQQLNRLQVTERSGEITHLVISENLRLYNMSSNYNLRHCDIRLVFEKIGISSKIVGPSAEAYYPSDNSSILHPISSRNALLDSLSLLSGLPKLG